MSAPPPLPRTGRARACEKDETQSFYNAFFDMLGVRLRNVARCEAHVEKLDSRSGFIDLFSGRACRSSSTRALAPN